MHADFEEQKPGENKGQTAVFDTPLYHVPDEYPCSKCGHIFAEHKFMYRMGTHDRYRCEHLSIGTPVRTQCDCGKAYMPVAFALREEDVDTEEKRQAMIVRMQEAQRTENEKFDR